MTEDEKTEQKIEQKTEVTKEDLKAPPPTEYTTKLGRVFQFGKPALKHRTMIMKVLKMMANETADYDAIIKCAKDRGLSVEQFLKLDETELTKDEIKSILKKSELIDSLEFADSMNEVLTEALYATIKKAPFTFETIKDFEEKMDDYSEAIELFPIAIKWVAQSAEGMSALNKNRKN